MRKINLLSIVCAAFMVLSCENSLEPELAVKTDSLNTTSAQDSLVLLTEWKVSYKNGDIEKRQYFYNEKNQVVKIIEGASAFESLHQLFYDEQGRLNEHIDYSGIDTSGHKSSYIYSYNGDTITLVNHSTFGINDDYYDFTLTKFILDEDEQIVYTLKYYGREDSSVIAVDSTSYIWVANNIMQTEREYLYYNAINENGLETNTKQGAVIHKENFCNECSEDEYMYAYDTKKNPLPYIGIKEIHNLPKFISVNNIIYDGGHCGFTYSYEYNDKDYPISGLIKNNDAEEIATITYKYKE